MYKLKYFKFTKMNDVNFMCFHCIVINRIL